MAGIGTAPDFTGTFPTVFDPAASGSTYHGSSIANLVLALTQAQREFEPLLKDTENPYFKSKYADLAGVIKTTLPSLNKHGLTIIQLTGTDFVNKAGTVTTILAHKSGETLSSFLSVPTGAKFDAQSLGAALTYGKRYAYQAIIGVAADIDDDGNSIATGFDDPPKQVKYEPKPGKKPGYTYSKTLSGQGDPAPNFYMKKETGWQEVGKEEFISGKSPESGQPPKAIIPNTNANFPADHEPTKEEKDQFKKIARDYVQTLLPGVGVENPAETLKTFVEKLTGQSDTKKLTYNQWALTLETLKQAVTDGKLKEVVEG